mgnify:FL=1
MINQQKQPLDLSTMAKTIEKRLNRRRPSISPELTGDCINLELLQLNNDSHDDEKRLEPMDDREVAEAAVEKCEIISTNSF